MAMPAPNSTTRWRDASIIPTDYEDIAALVKLARRARGRVVEFDWAFSRDDLLSLRRAVYEWGRAVRGVFRCFDARVLSAINDALGDPSTVLVLPEPKGAESWDYVVSCVPDGDGFRLRGHGTFDVVFGYGSGAVQQTGDGRAFLSPAVRETLTTSVAMLSWDL